MKMKSNRTKNLLLTGMVVGGVGVLGIIVSLIMIFLNRGDSGSLFAALTSTSLLLFLGSLIVALTGAVIYCATMALKRD